MTARYAPIGGYGVVAGVSDGRGRDTPRWRLATLLAVNVGLPQDVAWRGATVHTGVWKRAVIGPRMVRRLNIDGDGHGTSTGTGTSSARYSSTRSSLTAIGERELGRDDFVHGKFGENFTLDGLPDDDKDRAVLLLSDP
jgi:MOSC domain-containing protein YiiM